MPALFKSANACNLLRRNLLLDTWLTSREIIEHSQLRGASTATLFGSLHNSPTHPHLPLGRSTVRRARLTVSVRFHAAGASAYVSERGTVKRRWLSWYVRLQTLRRKYTAMLHTGIGIGIGYWYRQWPVLLDIGYWVTFLVSF